MLINNVRKMLLDCFTLNFVFVYYFFTFYLRRVLLLYSLPMNKMCLAAFIIHLCSICVALKCHCK